MRREDDTLVSCHAVILQWLVWNKHFEWRIWASLVPIVGGILLTSVTELSFNIFGFCAAMVGCLATSTKTILAESLLHGYKFDRYNLVLCYDALVLIY
jgi:drug/metabolite transporter (DMT)-like permease